MLLTVGGHDLAAGKVKTGSAGEQDKPLRDPAKNTAIE